jgi:S-layer protein (TIGR01564 family)
MAKGIELFDLVKIMFTNSSEYKKLKNVDKGRHSFLINRFFSIKYPSTAQSLNFGGVNGIVLVDLWQMVAMKYSKVPGWIYTKTKKTEKEKEWYPDKEIAQIYMNRHQLTEKDLKDMIKFNPEETKKIFDKLKKQLDQ